MRDGTPESMLPEGPTRSSGYSLCVSTEPPYKARSEELRRRLLNLRTIHGEGPIWGYSGDLEVHRERRALALALFRQFKPTYREPPQNEMLLGRKLLETVERLKLPKEAQVRELGDAIGILMGVLDSDPNDDVCVRFAIEQVFWEQALLSCRLAVSSPPTTWIAGQQVRTVAEETCEELPLPLALSPPELDCLQRRLRDLPVDDCWFASSPAVEEGSLLRRESYSLDFLRPPLATLAALGLPVVSLTVNRQPRPPATARVLCIDLAPPSAQILSLAGHALEVVSCSVDDLGLWEPLRRKHNHLVVLNILSPHMLAERKRALAEPFRLSAATTTGESLGAEWQDYCWRLVGASLLSVPSGGYLAILGIPHGGAHHEVNRILADRGRFTPHLEKLLHSVEKPVWFPQSVKSPGLATLGLPQPAGRLLSLWRRLE
jgi:hypothetical protein